MNQQHLQPLLSELVRKPFFRYGHLPHRTIELPDAGGAWNNGAEGQHHAPRSCCRRRFFKVNLYCDCQFWPDAGTWR